MTITCDFPRCPARALFRLTISAGALEVCGHHANEIGESLDHRAGVLEDLEHGTTEAFGPELVPVPA